MGFFSKGPKSEFEITVVNEPSVFEPLEFYCTSRTLVITTVFCYQRFCCKIEFAVIKKLDMDPSEYEYRIFLTGLLLIIRFVYFLESPWRGDSNEYPKTYVSQRITWDCQ